MSDQGDIGIRIKQVRSTRGGLTQEEFARQLGKTTRGAVGNWERGLGIKRDNLAAIAETFSVSFEWLASGRGQMDLKAPEPTNAYIGDRLHP